MFIYFHVGLTIDLRHGRADVQQSPTNVSPVSFQPLFVALNHLLDSRVNLHPNNHTQDLQRQLVHVTKVNENTKPNVQHSNYNNICIYLNYNTTSYFNTIGVIHIRISQIHTSIFLVLSQFIIYFLIYLLYSPMLWDMHLMLWEVPLCILFQFFMHASLPIFTLPQVHELFWVVNLLFNVQISWRTCFK